MQQQLYDLLIKRAEKGQLITYAEVSAQTGIHNGTTLFNLLGDISRHEHAKERPLLSVVVVRGKEQVPGEGFFDLARELGKSFNDKFDFFVQESRECFEYWRNQKSAGKTKSTHQAYQIPFFTQNDIELLAKWANVKYDKADKKQGKAGEQIKQTCWQKTKYWANELEKLLSGFTTQCRADWVQHGQKFTPYTWAKIYRKGHDKKGVFFTVGIHAKTKELVYKLDYNFREDGGDLNKSQKRILAHYLQTQPEKVSWNGISVKQAKDWNTLLTQTKTFIEANLIAYDDMIKLVSSNAPDLSSLKDFLIEQPVPQPNPQKVAQQTRKFTAQPDKDYVKEAKINTQLGNAGEQLVLAYEKRKLKILGLSKEMEQVAKQPDGVGYDIRSYDESGQEIHIEVKTTTGNEKTPFHMSANEKEFARLYPENYYVYRLYNYDEARNSANFFIVKDLHQRAIFEPTNFKVSI